MAVLHPREEHGGSPWPTVLVGPVIWISHFMLVYLVAEAFCEVGASGPRMLGLPVVSVVTVAATLIAVAVIGVAAVRAWLRLGPEGPDGDEPPVEQRSGMGRLRGRDHPLVFTGLLLDVLSIMAVLFVGVPAIVLQPC